MDNVQTQPKDIVMTSQDFDGFNILDETLPCSWTLANAFGLSRTRIDCPCFEAPPKEPFDLGNSNFPTPFRHGQEKLWRMRNK